MIFHLFTFSRLFPSDGLFLTALEMRLEMVSQSIIFTLESIDYLGKNPLIFIKSGENGQKITKFSLRFFHSQKFSDFFSLTPNDT